MAKIYSDLGKNAKKLLSDDYVDSLKLKVKSTTAAGVAYTVDVEQIASGEAVGGEVHWQIPLYGHKLTTKLYTSGKGTAELKLDKLGVPGLTATLLGGIGKEVAVGTAEFKHGPIGATAAYDHFDRAGHASLTAALAPTGYAGFCVVGVSGRVTGGPNLKKLDFCVSYLDGEESECTVHVNDKGTVGQVSYSHHVRPGFSVAGQFSYDQPKDSSLLTMGCAARLDNHTFVKGKINSNGLLSASYIQDIRPRTKLILSSRFNVVSLDNAKFGISLALE